MQNEPKEDINNITTENSSKEETPKDKENSNNPPTNQEENKEKVKLKEVRTFELKSSKSVNIEQKTNTENQQKMISYISKDFTEGRDSNNSALSNSDLSDNEVETIKTRTASNKKMDLKTFYKQNRQYFIMNSGGTPIYSRYGDEIINCSIFATFSAIITKFTVFNGGDNENLNYIKNEYSLIVFLKKDKIFLIAVSNKNDSVSFLYSQLEIIYHTLLSIITNERMMALSEKPSACAKFISENNPLFEQIIEYTSHTLVGILKSYQVLPIDGRNKLNEICSKYRGESLVTCLITVEDKEIFAISKSSVIELTYADIILIQCLIMFKTCSDDKEIWLPVCLPGISADGLLQLYYTYSPLSQYGILYITEKQENTSMSTFKDLSKKLNDEIKEKGLIPNIDKAIETKKNADYIKEEILNNPQEVNIEQLKDFIKKTFSNKNSKFKSGISGEMYQKTNTFTEAYKNFATSMVNPTISGNNIMTSMNNSKITKLVSIGKIICKQSSKNDPILKLNYGIIQHRGYSQYFSINLHSFEFLTNEEKYILKSYSKLYDYYITFKNLNSGDKFFHIEKDNKYSHGIYVNDSYIIFATLNVFKPTNEINEVFKEIIKMAKQYEGNLFVSMK